jgi:hypothetical protein
MRAKIIIFTKDHILHMFYMYISLLNTKTI